MMEIILALVYAISSLYNVIDAVQITCDADPSSVFYNLQFDHITNETYDGPISYQIGWVKVMSCDEGYDTQFIYPDSISYMESIAPYAISVKIVPDDFSDPVFDNYAVYAKVCQNPMISVNNLLELSNTIDVNTLYRTGPSSSSDWYGLNGATSRLTQSEYCHCPASATISTSPFHPCSGTQKYLQIYTKYLHDNTTQDVCVWDRNWRNSAGQNRNKNIAIYFGFDANKESMCDGAGTGGLQSVSGNRKSSSTHVHRRILQQDNYYDNTTGELYNAPCLTLGVQLETENLLPTNNDPDPTANIFLIGKALGGSSNGMLYMVDISDPELEDGTSTTTLSPEDSEYVWDVDGNCTDETQVQDSYFPTEIINTNLNASSSGNSDGFNISVPYTTPSSILYVFEICALPLTISHSCSNAISIFAEIYKNGELVNASEVILVPANEIGEDRNKLLEFVPTVQLLPGTSYEIIFSGIYGVPNDCNLNKISVGEGINRRRMQDEEGYFSYDDFAANANPNSCLLGKGLAKSNNMKMAVEAMCNDDLSGNRVIMEEGLFQHHASQNAIKNHLAMDGSLKVYDENGTLTFSTDDWPVNVKKPCIAIDQDNLTVFAIGGYDESTGKAVNTIQVWQFDDDSLTNGSAVTDLEGWRLDKKRYGSMCLYWKRDDGGEYIIVVSGMFKKTKEFEDKSKFFDDIRIFEVPTNAAKLNEWNGIYGIKSYSKPESGTVKIAKPGLLDSKLLLYNNHILYFFGGKTDYQSKQFVSRFDLNKIDASDAGGGLETMKLNEKKALPVVDTTAIKYDTLITTCYMIFGGQSYDNNTVVDGEAGLSFDNLQLFCNPQIGTDGKTTFETISVERRRLEENINDVVTFSEFDKLMFEKGKTNKQNVRRLTAGPDVTQVFLRNYDYGLDGIWYDFNVQVELCYENNSELKKAQDFYMGVTNSAELGDEIWINYSTQLSAEILSESEEAYFGWSNGFGAVNVYDLDLLKVNYFDCRPVIKINVNEGCDENNIELIDTDVIYTNNTKYYTSFSDIGAGDPALFTTKPFGNLAQIILNHSCQTDIDNVIISPHAHTRSINHDHNYNHKNINNWSFLDSYPWYYFVIACLAIYNIIISFIMYCKKAHKRQLEKQVQFYDSSDNDSIL